MRGLFSKADEDAEDAIQRERLARTSPDLPYELQSKMLDQLATVGIAGTGLAITLIGSLLQGSSGRVWISVAFFALAALIAVDGNIRLINGISDGKPVLRRSRRDVMLSLTMIGAAAGFLSMEMFDKSNEAPEAIQVAEAGGASAPVRPAGTE